MADSLKRKTGLALFWSFVDKGGQQVIQFVFVYILARLVIKEEFGLVTVLAIFTAIANILQESGFSSALIRKKEVQPQEYSSVFYFNISVSLGLYILFFFCAPLISSFYGKPVLTDLSRFIFLAFVFNSFGIIQNVHLIKSLNFKINTRITLLAGIISGLIAIALAYNGFGVWSLAAQQVMQSFIRSLLLWIFVKWRPVAGASFIHIKEMSSFSLKLLLTSLLNQICANIFPLIIGKKFSFAQVAAYGQGVKLSSIPQSVISDGIKSVAYPLLSNIGEDNQRGKRIYRKIIRITAFISFPVALSFITLAKPIVSIYLPPEWSDVIPILQILAIGGAFYPLYGLVGSLLQYKGRSGLLLKIEIFRNILLLLSILLTFRYGVLGLVGGISLVNVVSFFTGIYFSGKTIAYTLKEALMDITPYMGIAIVSFLPFLFLYKIGIENIYLLLLIPLIAGSCLYLLIVKILGSVIIQETIDFIKQSLK
ncbi:teichuronic acid exporter [Dysgonomonas sp. PFB1-18]|uniref:lipopolysaccharide biosynthesis protein n=1 Tax=unclassified Dysgonomonas TaxID=2630389 RepID=UPI00247305F4|nr:MULTISPECIES: lipopolysaccharide biosynthesis protein [unclassified Dysgonomonas]MDH6309840.1 teichuronic acid exporter [Dysgonomonas sp. PF1-14]MDH6339384.1 teichuronic acid exporter [Dysgonomonas sp. PF1-16]MDH6380883.1 teichuronic acid exporter [Dysgonomonas sp. PFB1-18]MDH6397892.1 teichuronic acid exporter [Dysgonomonas sp. PF1-23]